MTDKMVKVGNAICHKCQTAHPFEWDCTLPPLYTRPAPVVEDGLVERCAISAQVGPEQFAENAKMPPAALSPLANATYAIAGLVTGEDWSLDVVKVSVVIHEYAEACVTAALRAQSEGEAEREAIVAWLLRDGERWDTCEWSARDIAGMIKRGDHLSALERSAKP